MLWDNVNPVFEFRLLNIKSYDLAQRSLVICLKVESGALILYVLVS